METFKENQNLKIQPLPFRSEGCMINSQLQLTEPLASNYMDKRRFLATNGELIKSEVFENASAEVPQMFPTNTSILSNVCNVALPVSSTSARIAEMIRTESFLTTQLASKNKRKSKTLGTNNLEQSQANNSVLEVVQRDKLQYEENKQSEVLNAAKSLFSKRTRTLYHWMYPNASKQQLKLAITNSWETLSVEEKEFYISQVLGRFGFPQRSLMVNPQLGCISNLTQLPNFPVDVSLQASEETRNAVSSILNESRNGFSRIQIETDDGPSCVNAKRRKLYRTPGRRGRSKKGSDTMKMTQEVVGADEFQDDPELSREFQQFKWTLRMTDDGK